MSAPTDLLVVGAGIIGLAHAYEAHRRGLSVRIVERDLAPNGASIRNFGHACITAQAGDLLPVAYRSREGWLRAAEDVGFWAPTAGAVVVARSALELGVLEELHAQRGSDAVALLTPEGVRARLGQSADPAIVGGAFLPADLRVDPRTTAGQIARWLQSRDGVSIEWGTSVGRIEGGTVQTSRGEFHAARVLVCVGHDLDYLYPQVADAYEVTRCALQMALAPAPSGYTLDSAVLSGTSMTRYPGFTTMPGYDALHAELLATHPDLLEMGANCMSTRRPDGTLLLGDSHVYARTMPPFEEEGITARLVAEMSRILGRPLEITQRWQGVYASSPRTPLLIEDVDARTRCITVTSGIGMTLSFGIAAQTLDSLEVGSTALSAAGV